MKPENVGALVFTTFDDFITFYSDIYTLPKMNQQ